VSLFYYLGGLIMNAAGFLLGCTGLLIYLYVTDFIDFVKNKRQINRSKHILSHVSKNEVSEMIIPLKKK